MEKKMYIIPQTTAMPLTVFSGIMITSVGQNGNMPGEPGQGAPARRNTVPVF